MTDAYTAHDRARIIVIAADSGAVCEIEMNVSARDVIARGGSGAQRIRGWIADVGEPLARRRARQSGGRGEATTSWAVSELNG